MRRVRRGRDRLAGSSRQLHGDYDALEHGGNGCVHCCGEEPTLRVRKERVSSRGFSYVEYECRRCGRRGGVSLFEDTARAYWNEWWPPY
ncbi:MAG TPA: hypothetical protein VGH90_06105 [Chthoniobacteraceae bacterium]